MIAAFALLPFLLLVILLAPTIITAILLGLLCAVAAYELLAGTGLVKNIRLIAYSALTASIVPIWCYFGSVKLWAVLGLSIFTVLLFSELLVSKAKVRIEKISVCFIAGVLIPYLLSALVRIICVYNGRHLLMIPFALAFLSDSGAYFVGRAFGRHKLAPVISPNKSVEGMLGGVATAVIGMLLFCLISDLVMPYRIHYLNAVAYGVVGSFAGVFGDLCFSAIKRQTGIKDYGNLIPGHGGILDRFDSLVVIAPLVEVLMMLLPVVG